MLIPMTEGNGRDEALRNQRLDAALEQIARGDRQALAALYRETNPAVYGFAFSVVKNAHDAEDVLQDTYLRIYAAAPGYVSVGKPMAWILTICRNLCLQRLRERTRQAEIPQEDWERYLEGCPGVTTEDRMVIAECMNKLSDEERQIVVLHAVAGFKHREIGELLELGVSTVLSKYHRAIKKLKEEMGKEQQAYDRA